jgi:hypothetical protein
MFYAFVFYLRMITSPLTPDRLAASVLAVPPLGRRRI